MSLMATFPKHVFSLVIFVWLDMILCKFYNRDRLSFHEGRVVLVSFDKTELAWGRMKLILSFNVKI